MKRIYYFLAAALLVMGLSACKKSYRTIYPVGNPKVEAQMLTDQVVYGLDTISFRIHISETETPLSYMTLKVLVGNTVQLAAENVRTKGLDFNETFHYAVPFGPNMEEGTEIKVYISAINVEGTETQLILGGCYGHRPLEIQTLYLTRAYPNDGASGIDKKGLAMQQDTEDEYGFSIDGIELPKVAHFFLTEGNNKFGKVDLTKAVFGMVDGQITLLNDAQKEAIAQAPTTETYPFAIELSDDQAAGYLALTFNTLTWELNYTPKILTPVEKLDINKDLEANPTYMSASVAKKYLGAKVFFDKNSIVEITGVNNLSKAYNRDWMEYQGDNKVKFLGDKAIYYVSYNIEGDYLVVEPMYDLAKPDVMYLCGVGMGQPTQAPAATSGWGFDSPDQNFVGRPLGDEKYQFTVYMKNDTDTEDHPGFGSVNFKFFHQHGWGGEENAAEMGYKQECCPGMVIVSSEEEGNVGNWWSKTDPAFEGIYRITLDMKNHITKYEKVD